MRAALLPASRTDTLPGLKAAAGPNHHFREFGSQSPVAAHWPAGNEGVGEHVRTKSQLAKAAGENCGPVIRTE